MGEDRGIPSDAGMGRYYCVVDGHSDMGPEKRYQRFTNPEQLAARLAGNRRANTNRTNSNSDRDQPGGNPGIHGSDPAPQGVILGRLYRLIFGGSRYTKNHDAEVQVAQQRVNKALEGLDEDVLILMQATMIVGLD